MRMDAKLDHNYRSLGELKAASSVVVLGSVGFQSVQTVGHDVYTISVVHVDRLIWSKGTPSNSVAIRQFGGTNSAGVTYEMDGFPVLLQSARYVFFLTPAQEPGEYYPVGMFQGIFSVDGNGVVSSYSSDSPSIGVNLHNIALDSFDQMVKSA